MDALQEGRNSGARRPNLISVTMLSSVVVSLLPLDFFVGGLATSVVSSMDGGDEAR
jgi:hypothetical protein